MNYEQYSTKRIVLLSLLMSLTFVSFLAISSDQSPLELLWPSLQVPDYDTTYSPPTHCDCNMANVRASKQTKLHLYSLLPWLNMTTGEDLNIHHPNFPVKFLYDVASQKSCQLIPTPLSIMWKNRYWQELELEEGKLMYLYSAFYDPNPGAGDPCLRLLGMSMAVDPGRTWCHVWYDPQEPPVLTSATVPAYLDWQSKDGRRQMSYLITCPLPNNTLRVPAAVSLVATPCTPATTLLKVVGARERESSAYVDGQVPKDLNSYSKNPQYVAAVCGPMLYYYSEDYSRRLVEWLEILRAEGFAKVFVYDAGVHPNMSKVLRHYERDGFLHVTSYSFPPPYIDEPSLHRYWTQVERHSLFAMENIFYSDCPLRHMHQYRYLAHLDADEVPILPNHRTYTELLHQLRNDTSKYRSGFKLQWNYFYNDLEPVGEATKMPEYLWFLRHTTRLNKTVTPTPGMFKALYDMDVTRGVFAHGVLRCTKGPCSIAYMKRVMSDIAYIGHFSKNCGKKCEAENSTRQELSLHKYKDQVTKAVEKTLTELKLF